MEDISKQYPLCSLYRYCQSLAQRGQSSFDLLHLRCVQEVDQPITLHLVHAQQAAQVGGAADVAQAVGAGDVLGWRVALLQQEAPVGGVADGLADRRREGHRVLLGVARRPDEALEDVPRLLDGLRGGRDLEDRLLVEQAAEARAAHDDLLGHGHDRLGGGGAPRVGDTPQPARVADRDDRDPVAVETVDLGLEVEEVINPADKLKDFKLGYVTHAEKHPDADKLRVCKVDTDEGELQIICGAPNAREGITVVVCKPGMYIPGLDITIGVGKIRGVESFGMMASERELELSEEHDGIIELPTGNVGDSFVDWLAENDPAKVDPVIEIAITPNRPDALGVYGIARDLAARGLGTLKTRAFEAIPGDFDSPIKVTIDADTLDGCPLFAGRVIKGVKNGPSPQWLQDRLKAIGLRPISALVDITNFFTFDQNRPLHVFDAAKVSGDLRVHRAQGGETLKALDEKEYIFGAGQMVISDANGPESIGGIMGGEETGCTEETVDVFLESAFWDHVQIAMAGRALKINSDARYRFERGVDPEFTRDGLELATQMILDLCGGEASDVVVAGKVPNHARAYKLDPARVQSLVGMDIPESEQRQTLTRLGFRLEGNMAHVPSWRPDVQGEADLGHGMTAVPLPGHTAGHMGVMLESGGDALLIWGDIVHVPPVQFARPDVTIGFDFDADMARATRQSILDRAATDRLRVAGMHIGFPGTGYVERAAQGYHFVSAPYPYG